MFSSARAIEYRMKRTFELARTAARDLSDSQLRTSLGSKSLPIGWHLWHMARWSDRLHSRLNKAREIWTVRGLAVEWGWEPSALGEGESGMEMQENAALALPIPAKGRLGEYVDECFESLSGTMSLTSDDDLHAVIQDFYGRNTELGAMLLNHTSHMDRHLGMIEALRGMGGHKGTATV